MMAVNAPLALGEVFITIRQLLLGRTNALSEFTCATGAATTAISNAAIQVGDTLLVTPKTANAGAELASGNFYIEDATAAETITVMHTNSATTGRTFAYEVRGA